MGLDIVEMVMEIEEAFDIRIADDEAAQITTLGRLHSCIHQKRRSRGTWDYCPSSRAFYRLRRALAEEFGVGRECVTTAAPVDGLLPRDGRQQHWGRLGELLGGWEMPFLRRPAWAVWVIALPVLGMGMCALGCAAVVATKAGASAFLLLALGIVPCAALLSLAFRFTQPYAIELPRDCETVRGFVGTLLRTNYGRLVTEPGGIQRDLVWERMCDIVSEQLGVDRNLLTPDTRFIDDLGAE
jgi:acyl carrier protein